MASSKRLEKNFQHLAGIGQESSGGFTRLAFSDTDWEAREFVIGLMKQAGLVIRVDAFGNVIGRREGVNPAASVIMTGSHIDSVPHGGNYDGVVGTLGAIEALQCLEEAGEKNYHPIEVVVFMSEESSRFGVATLGSKAFCGKLSREKLDELKDKQGLSLADVLRQRNLSPDNIAEAHYKGGIKSFLEIHIEQGKVLETTQNQLGVVTGIAAPTRLRVMFTGQADHSGATPMNMRQDALTAAAEVILQVEAFANEEAHNAVVGTTGIVKAEPGVMNVIPGKVELGIDIRGIDAPSKQRVVDKLKAEFEAIKKKRGVGIEVVVLSDDTPVKLPDHMVEFLYDICQQSSYKSIRMPSGAGHDAMHIATLADTGMVFIPCRDGISHNPAEHAKIEDITAATEVLTKAIQKLAAKE